LWLARDRHFGGMPHFDDGIEQGHLNLLGSR
jgi:hypothetical protein